MSRPDIEEKIRLAEAKLIFYLRARLIDCTRRVLPDASCLHVGFIGGNYRIYKAVSAKNKTVWAMDADNTPLADTLTAEQYRRHGKDALLMERDCRRIIALHRTGARTRLTLLKGGSPHRPNVSIRLTRRPRPKEDSQ